VMTVCSFRVMRVVGRDGVLATGAGACAEAVPASRSDRARG
jgi:hypothetical protein